MPDQQPAQRLAQLLVLLTWVAALLVPVAVQPASALPPPPARAMPASPQPASPQPTAPQPAVPVQAAVVEQLRLSVPAADRQAWLEAERGSWGPWLGRQDGFLGRDLYWDPAREEATLLIRWASRGQWQAIPAGELAAVQERFERIARQATGRSQGNPFPLVFEGELEPL
ncbi:MAG: TIGR03792 family protein [Prochlorococcaceae cyanobacterium]